MNLGIWEIQMNKVQMLSLSLAAVLVGPVHAQLCSGGDGGGIDATGNQCSTPNEVVVSAEHPSFWARYEPLIRWAKMSGGSSTPTVVAAPARRMVRAAVPASTPVKTAKVQNGSEAPCSGGAYGGMDVNGNQCGEAPVPEGSNLVARNKTP
jgi:hypothetical protein